MIHSAVRFVRTFFQNSASGMNTLHVIISQPVTHMGPKNRFMNTSISNGLPWYHTRKISVKYAYPTISEVNRHSLAILSKWSSVTHCSSFRNFRSGTMMVTTMPTPEKIAPATKYGAKMVLCQPGLSDIAKSHDTTLCTDSTSGVANAARYRYAPLKFRHAWLVPRQP